MTRHHQQLRTRDVSTRRTFALPIKLRPNLCGTFCGAAPFAAPFAHLLLVWHLLLNESSSRFVLAAKLLWHLKRQHLERQYPKSTPPPKNQSHDSHRKTMTSTRCLGVPINAKSPTSVFPQVLDKPMPYPRRNQEHFGTTRSGD